jgi:hypothetical protein
MGEGTPGVGTSTVNSRGDDQTPRARAERLGSEIAVVRDELDRLVAELDRRRHSAFDVREHVGRHALGLTLTGLALAATAAGGVWLNGWRQSRRARLPAQAGRLQHAIARMTEHPERVAAEPTMAGRIVTAAASAAVAALVKKLLERAAQHLLDERPGVRGAALPAPERGDQLVARRWPELRGGEDGKRGRQVGKEQPAHLEQAPKVRAPAGRRGG